MPAPTLASIRTLHGFQRPRLPMKRGIDAAAAHIPRSIAKSYRMRFALGVAVLIIFPFAALSQVAPSLVTPQTLRPEEPRTPGSLPPPSSGTRLQAPAGTERLSFIVGRVVVEGAPAEFESETRPLVHAIERHRITVAQIMNLPMRWNRPMRAPAMFSCGSRYHRRS